MGERREKARTISGAAAMAQGLAAHGVSHVFGLCGDTSLPFYDALSRRRDIRHILARDERHAAFMADGYARVSGRVGVCEAPSGGGALYLLPGVSEADESSAAMVAISTDIAVAARGRFALTALNQEALFAPVTKYNATIQTAEQTPRMLRAAFRAAASGRPGAAHLCFPFDSQTGVFPAAQKMWAQPELGAYPAWPTAPDPAAVSQAAARILKAKKPLAICGGGVFGKAQAALAEFAESLNLPVASAISGKGALADTHPNCVGVVGANGGTAATRAVVRRADLVIFIGCRAGSVTTERWRYPAPGVGVIHIDNDPMTIGANYPVEVALAADAKLALEALNAELCRRKARVDFNGAAIAKRARAAKFAAFSRVAANKKTPLRPEAVISALNQILPPEAIVAADAGTPCPYFSAYYQLPLAGRRFLSNRAHGALGYALACALGAHFAAPRAKVVAAMGDGSFAFSAGELETVTRLAPPLLMVVFSNSSYGWIKAGQKAKFGARYFGVDFSPTDHAAVASAFGIYARRVVAPEELSPALKAAAARAGPALVDVVCQPLEESRAPVAEWIA